MDHSTLLLQDIYCFVACFGIRFKVPVVVSTVLCDLATVSFSVYSYSSQSYHFLSDTKHIKQSCQDLFPFSQLREPSR